MLRRSGVGRVLGKFDGFVQAGDRYDSKFVSDTSVLSDISTISSSSNTDKRFLPCVRLIRQRSSMFCSAGRLGELLAQCAELLPCEQEREVVNRA